ncbi:MAG: formate/nitrite transporter family protein [Candidatus Baltobacteraceae bacterium]
MSKTKATGRQGAQKAETSNTIADLSASEEQQVRKRTTPRPEVVFETVRREGNSELERAPAALAFSGLAAGLSMGFSLVFMGVLRAHLPDEPWRPLVEAGGYTVGFVIVILARQQLFTENTVTPILPLLDAQERWPIFVRVSQIGMEALAPSASAILVRGIFAGWLIALMVWLLPAADTQKLWVIIIVTYLVGVLGLSHIIAGSVDVLYAVAAGQASWGSYLGHFLIPVFSAM